MSFRGNRDLSREEQAPLVGEFIAADEALADDDTEGAVMVIVFRLADETTEEVPGSWFEGKSSMIWKNEMDKKAANCKDDFKKIFKLNREELNKFEEQDDFNNEMTFKEYNRMVRQKFAHVINEIGFNMSIVTSVDKDEIFVRINADDERFAEIAERSLYSMPLSETAYAKAFEDQGITNAQYSKADYQNDFGDFVYYYDHFDRNLGEQCWDDAGKSPFKCIDKIRLIMNKIQLKVNLEALKKQQIMSHYFFVDAPDALAPLVKEWTYWNVFCNPCCNPKGNSHLIRDYFGEQVAYYYLFLGTYLRSLVFPVGVAIILVPTENIYNRLNWNFHVINSAKVGYGLFIIVWVLALQKIFNRRINRANQRWGMYAYDDTIEPNLYTYVEGRTLDRIQEAFHHCGALAAPAYCLAFFYAEKYIVKACSPAWEGIVTSAMIFSFGWVWAKLAPIIVSYQNHRTQARFDNALILVLGLVKLFLVLYPFLRVSFIQQWEFDASLCGSSLAETANKVFASSEECPNANGTLPWPTGDGRPGILTCSNVEDWFGQYTFERSSQDDTLYQMFIHQVLSGTLQHNEDTGDNSSWTNSSKHEQQFCPYGCIPQICDTWFEDGGAERQSCLTNCYFSLRSSIQTYYATDISCTFIFIIIPLIMKKYAVREESHRASGGDSEPAKLTQLAIQEKKKEIAPYGYYEWGGSYVEDFLQVMLGFALSNCFGMFAPELMVIGFLALSVQYKLLVMRMTQVTSRPYPLGAKGIGTFSKMLEVIATISVIVNAGMLVYVMRTPMMIWSPIHKALIFCFIWAGCGLFRTAINVLLPEEAKDVEHIHDANHKFIRLLRRKLAHERLANRQPKLDPGSVKPVPLVLDDVKNYPR